MRVWPGSPQPLGATWDGEGTNFAIFTANGTAVELCLFDTPGAAEESERIRLVERDAGVWHAYLPDVRPGQCYGYRVHGPYDPAAGHRFNPAKLLIDPYARALSGPIQWSPALYGYRADAETDDTPDPGNSAAGLPKCLVADPAFPWGDDRPPRTPWNRTIIYECHVRGMTMRHPGVAPEFRGTYLGLATDPIINHLRALGVTAVQLLPVHHRVSQQTLVDHGLTNYWGYNTIGFFAPDVRFAADGIGQQVAEFKTMVKRLHRAGLEVLLDVVYNHTGEGNHRGATVAFRGVDNASYYRLDPDDRSRYVDCTGCGNTLNVAHPRTLQLILDSLRYWVTEMHVDGFRFDLASALAREPEAFSHQARFFEIVRQDPVLSRVKLIAEPWDLCHGGYQLGGFPSGWVEWNDRYRDAARRFWRGHGGVVPELASRMGGSSDVFANGRGPFASVNFVTCHDGFTLRDLVSYEHKHNEANQEDNRDGTDTNYSRNWGHEGPTADTRITRLRDRVARNLLATLALSLGVPMISHGDELGRTQGGNNNAYCQDNEISWLDWDLTPAQRELLQFTRHVFTLRAANPVLRRRSFFGGEARPAVVHGRPIAPNAVKDVVWLRSAGGEMTEADWQDEGLHTFGMLMHGGSTDERDERGRLLVGESLLVLCNGGVNSRRFVIPSLPERGKWVEVINTARPGARAVKNEAVILVAHSLIVLRYEVVG